MSNTLGPRTAQPSPTTPTVPGLVEVARQTGRLTVTDRPSPQSDPNQTSQLAQLSRWAQGIEYRPNLPYLRDDGSTGAPGPRTWLLCEDADGEPQDPKQILPGPGNVEWDPYGIYDGGKCSMMAIDQEETRRRVVESLERQTSHVLEQVLYTGDVNGVQPGNNLALVDASTLGYFGLVSGLSVLIRAINDLVGAAEAWIHVPQAVIPYMSFYGQLFGTPENLFLNHTGHRVVAGTGYPSDFGGSAFIYATSPVDVRLTTISTVENYDRVDNTYTIIAERVALASFDETLNVGVEVCLPDPGPDCTPIS